ncbi:MAG: GntR family transcriptional regulator [Burkholderiales bacterium]
MAEKAETPLMRDDVYDRIRRDILSCAFRPGSQIHEHDLASRYAVSKSPIRDALLRLQEQGLVEVLPRKGYRVRPISVTDVREMYEMRLLLEQACIRRAAERATDVQLKALDRYREVPENIDMPAWIVYNRSFHIAVASVCGNLRLARAATGVIEQFDRLTYAGVSSLGERKALRRFVGEHAEIIEAMQRRDKRRATALAREHIDSSRKRLLAMLSEPMVVP